MHPGSVSSSPVSPGSAFSDRPRRSCGRARPWRHRQGRQTSRSVGAGHQEAFLKAHSPRHASPAARLPIVRRLQPRDLAAMRTRQAPLKIRSSDPEGAKGCGWQAISCRPCNLELKLIWRPMEGDFGLKPTHLTRASKRWLQGWLRHRSRGSLNALLNRLNGAAPSRAQSGCSMASAYRVQRWGHP